MKRTLRHWIELRNIVPLIAIVLAFLAALEVPQKLDLLSTEQVILAVLGVLAIDAVVERVGYLRRIEDSIKSGFGTPKAPFLQSRKDLARLPERAREAREILIIACSASSVLLDTEFFINRIRQGIQVRLAVVNPDADVVIDIIGRSDIVPAEIQLADMRTAAGLAGRIRAQVASTDLFEVRVFNYVPTLSFVMTDGYLPTGVITVEMYPYHIDPGQRPHVLVTAKDHPEWYGYFRNICEAIWQDAIPSPLHSS